MLDPLLTIVIPAFNEAQRIGASLARILAYIQSKSFGTEVIAVDDGSTDATAQLLQEFAERLPGARVLRHEPNRGKGFSVRRGVLEASGEYVLFTDADLSSPIEEADKLLTALEVQHADAAIGSRALNRKLIGVRQPWRREYGGRVFNLLVRAFTGLPLADTQCGFKMFRRATTRRAFELQTVNGFGFDPELLFIIDRQGGKILEIPVRWDDNPATKVHLLHDSTRMIFELALLRWHAWRGNYRA
jgi:glycosyltransferase involved in cell wall biosynthesis